jgi:hypothetical protein
MGGVLYRAVVDRNPPDAVSRLQDDIVAEALATARGRYSAPLLHAIEWALTVKPELRPQSVAEWKAAFDAQTTAPSPQPAPAASAATATVRAVAATAPATRPATLRTVPVQEDHGATWRRIGWIAFWVIAAMIAFGWYKRRPPPPVEPAPVARSLRQPPPVQVQVVPLPAERVVPVDPRPSREFAPTADPRERPSRPDGSSTIPDRTQDRVSEEFRGADRDGDGYLSPLEVEGRFPVIARDFGSVDRDGDRRISADEFADLRRRQFENRRAPPPGR